MLPFWLELSLHSVRSLIIGLPEPLDAARVLAWIRSCAAPVAAPVVQHLQFDFGPDGELVTSDVVELIKAVPGMLLLRAAHGLGTIRLLGGQVLALRNSDVSFAWEFCEQVRLEDGDHGCSLRRTDTMKLS
ncbi:hypothetical protein EXIGLDRAFT_719658 [Exidia glandulosa HHB12029]|uniref:Uncharacterized protein n=1 Tax=Exidia glandulosa HHB12029 TaxID=1314781 RepID=A0A165GWS4_EXIGL|nr:hypothetical protein EXIGLDRAFT_719658 [Exidia glandulosa HHB12029]